MQLPLFPLASDWRPVPVGDLPNWDGASRVGLDIETRDPTLKLLGPGVRRSGYIVGVSFAIEDGPAFYLPIKHGGGDNLDPNKVLEYLRDQARRYTGILVGANITYDLDYLAQAGVEFPALKFLRDVQIADPLINELHDSYSLDAIGKRWGFTGKDTGLMKLACSDHGLKDPGADLWQLPARYVADYAMEDAALPLRILRKQERAIEDEELWPVYDLESRVQPVLLKLTRRGVRIDEDALDRIDAWALKQEQDRLQLIHDAIGRKLKVGDVTNKNALLPVLTAIGITVGRTPTGQPKIDEEVLDGSPHPVATYLKEARKVNKLRTTFVASIRNHMTNGRIHCTFNQLRHTREVGDAVGARYGRLSSEHPNLQQQPSRDEFAKMWRSIYVPDEPGQLWLSADYSQQEPRILTHFAELLELPEAKRAGDRYRQDPKTDNHQMMAELCSIPRKQAKNIYLGLCYGMGGAKLARDLGLPTEWKKGRDGKRYQVAGPEAQRILSRFDRHAPFVRLLASRMEEAAREWGYILTLSGRRCHFPKKPDGEYDWCHKAINRLIQGSAADQTKTAMLEADRAGFAVQLQVHDELDMSITSIEQGQELARIMTECTPLSVPSRVDIEVGPSWGEAA